MLNTFRSLVLAFLSAALFLTGFPSGRLQADRFDHVDTKPVDERSGASNAADSYPLNSAEELLNSLPGLLAQTGGASLARAIRYSRDQALKDSYAMPAKIREALEPYFSRHILDKARYSTDWSSSSDLTLHRLLLATEYTSAVTLDNVIVFKNRKGVDDLWLWAHELKHVEQYDRWGVEAFAQKYAENYDLVEQEAYEYADYVVKQIAEKKKNSSGLSSQNGPCSGGWSGA